MKKILLIISFLSLILAKEKSYFQQHVAYDIEVTLNDSSHTLDAYEKIEYTNNSLDTLSYIWFHLWPNAYKNLETAFAKQRERFLSTKFLYSEEKDRGYIDSLNFVVDGVSANTEAHPEWIDVTKLILPEPILPGATIVIETPFYVKIPKVFSRLGHIGKHYEITQWYPKPAVYDEQGWHPMPYLNMGEFYSEFGSFNVKITLPKEYRIMATGDLLDGEDEYKWLDSLAADGDSLYTMTDKEFKKEIKFLQTGQKKEKKKLVDKIQSLFKSNKKDEDSTDVIEMKTLHFYQENVHDFAWFADKKWIVRKGELYLEDSTRQVTLWSMYKPKNAEQWENSIEYLHDSGYWYSQFLGDYPYNHITAVDGDLSAGGGMEYPNITVIAKMPSKNLLEMVIMHEVGHNWFYGILGNNERDHTWMDEGLNTFMNIRYWHKKYGSEAPYVINEFAQEKLGPFSIGKNLKYGTFEYFGYVPWVRLGDEEPLALSSNDFQRRANYGLSYSKAGIYSWHLLHYLGEDVIDDIMHKYYFNWKFKHPHPSDYFNLIKQSTDKNVDWYVDDVFNKTGIVDYSVSIKKDIATFTNHGSMTVPFEVAFYDDDKNEIIRKWFDRVEDSETMDLPKGTSSIIIDPDETLPDANRINNATSKPLALSWVVGRPQYYKREIFWMPWMLNANQYNGFTPGISFRHGYLNGYDYGISALPMWDFNNNNLIGNLKYKKIFYDVAKYYKSELKFEFKRNAGRSGIHLEFEGKRKQHLNRYPVYTTTLSLDYNDILDGAVDSIYYESGQTGVGYAEFELHNRPDPFLNYYVKAGLKIGYLESNFARLHAQTNLYYNFTKKIKTKLRLWLGGFLIDENVPGQYLTYLSGNIDPDFRNNSLFNRTGTENNISIGTRQYDVQGPSIHGIVLDNDRLLGIKKWIFSANIETTVPKLPVKPFIDIALVEDVKPYYDMGIKKSFGPITVILPLYQSWDKDKLAKDSQWIIDRLRFSFSL